MLKFDKKSILPEGYTQVEYLTSTGAQYIDTGLYATNNTKVVVKSRNILRIFGSYNTTSKAFTITTDPNYSGRFGSKLFYPPKTQAELHVYQLSADGLEIDGEKKTSSWPGEIFTTTGTCWIFKTNPSTVASSGTMYYLKVYDNDILVLNFIPAIDPNGRPCMYDLVTQQPFYNAGAGEFIVGPTAPTKEQPTQIKINSKDVARIGVTKKVLPKGYKKLKYIESDGNQYIDTNLYGTNNTEINIFCNVLDTVTGNYAQIFGSFTDEYTKARLTITSSNINSGDSRFGSITIKAAQRPPLSYNEDIQIKLNANEFAIDNVSFALSDADIFTTATPMYLFYIPGRPNRPIMRLYECLIKENGIPVSHLIPVKDNNGIGCLYDIVTEQTLYNSGTGNFILGDELEGNYIETVWEKQLDYYLLEYIASDGNQYIDTTITPDKNTKWILKTQVMSTSYHGCGNTTNNTRFRIGRSTAAFYIYRGSQTTADRLSNTSPSSIFVASIYDKNLHLRLDDTQQAVIQTGNYDFENDSNIYLFAANTTPGIGNYVTGKVYYSVIKQNGTIVQNLLPAQRKSDNKVGLLDTVTNTFFTNLGTGDFTAGPMIN